MCVIADDAAARGIAGVMGGEETGCTETTTNVFIESAYFDPVRTARDRTQARHHFGRALSLRARRRSGIRASRPGACDATDPRMVRRRSLRERRRRSAVPHMAAQIDFDPRLRSRGLAGSTCRRPKSFAILKQSWLSRSTDGADPEGHAAVLAQRCAMVRADLVEEVVRIYGLDNVPSVAMSAAACHRPRGSDPGPAPHASRAPHAGGTRIQ